jgi:hypothetical protein
MSKQKLTTEYFEQVVSKVYDSGEILPKQRYCLGELKQGLCGCAMGAFLFSEFGVRHEVTAYAISKITEKYIIGRNNLNFLTVGFDSPYSKEFENNKWFKLGQKLARKYKDKLQQWKSKS